MTDRNADRGLALWRAVQEVAKEWPDHDDVFGVGAAGEEVVVIRVHAIDQEILKNRPRKGRRNG